MSFSDEQFSFKVAVWSVHDPRLEHVQYKDETREKDEIFKLYKSMIRSELSIPGDITFYKGSLVNNKYELGKEISDLTQTLFSAIGKTGVLILKYDEKITVAAGGTGQGATATSKAASGVMAEGGMGRGGTIDGAGNARGGKGIGGGARGESFSGKAGDGYCQNPD